MTRRVISPNQRSTKRFFNRVASLPVAQGAPVIPERFCLESVLMGKDLPLLGG